MKKEVAEVVNALLDQGFSLKRTRAGHYIVSKEGKFVGTLAGTPSGHRWYRNTLAEFRRAGFVWPRP